MKYIKEELEQYIFIDKKSYREIGRIYGVSDTYIKKIANRLGITLSKRRIFPEGFIPANKGTRKIKYCIECNKEIDVYANKYCSNNCQAIREKRELYQDFINNNKQYCRASYQPKALKPIFLEEQENKCAICNMNNNWNNKSIIFILDHIDGDASNNKRENLRLVCPNCDSQLDTYKSKNKNSARKGRYLKNYKYEATQ